MKDYRCFLEKERLSVLRKLGSLAVLIFIVFSCKEPGEVSGLKQIISFALPKVKTVSVSIDETSGVISVIVPYGTILADINPEISISPDASIVPLAWSHKISESRYTIPLRLWTVRKRFIPYQ